MWHILAGSATCGRIRRSSCQSHQTSEKCRQMTTKWLRQPRKTLQGELRKKWRRSALSALRSAVLKLDFTRSYLSSHGKFPVLVVLREFQSRQRKERKKESFGNQVITTCSLEQTILCLSIFFSPDFWERLRAQPSSPPRLRR